MGYLLQMPAEIHDWLADLSHSDPPRARHAGEALTALMVAGADLGPPLVTPAPSEPAALGTSEELEEFYQDSLHQLQMLRRQAADAALTASQSHGTQPDVRHVLRLADMPNGTGQPGEPPRRPAIVPEDSSLSGKVQRLQTLLDTYRVNVAVLTAARTTALADDLLSDLTAGASTPPRDPASRPDPAVQSATRQVLDLQHSISQELGTTVAGSQPGIPPFVPDLLELHPPGTSLLILFATEPPGTALLLAILDGEDAIASRYSDAISLAATLLRDIQVGHFPPVTRPYHAPSFLTEFFPHEAGRIQAAAIALTTTPPTPAP